MGPGSQGIDTMQAAVEAVTKCPLVLLPFCGLMELYATPAERGPAKSLLDERDMEVVRGLVQALAGYTFATPSLIVRALTGILWKQHEADAICPPQSPPSDSSTSA
jgi:hypothetical protein